MYDSVFEPIEHSGQLPAKVFATGMDSSHYHWHDDYELLLVLKGSLTVFSGPEPLQLGAGELVLLNSRVVHGYRGGQGNLCLFIQFAPRLLEPLAGEGQIHYFYLNSKSPRLAPKGGYGPFVGSAARIGLAGLDRGGAAALRTTGLLQLLLADMLDEIQYDIRRYPKARELPPDGHMAAQIGAYVNDNCNRHGLAEELCRHFAISEKSLYRYTKRALGLSPKEMIDKARVERAKAQLRHSGCPVSLVGEQCGFTSEVTFHRVFKRETGRTPNAYRREESKALVGPDIQGYLSFDEREAINLLKQYAGA